MKFHLGPIKIGASEALSKGAEIATVLPPLQEVFSPIKKSGNTLVDGHNITADSLKKHSKGIYSTKQLAGALSRNGLTNQEVKDHIVSQIEKGKVDLSLENNQILRHCAASRVAIDDSPTRINGAANPFKKGRTRISMQQLDGTFQELGTLKDNTRLETFCSEEGCKLIKRQPNGNMTYTFPHHKNPLERLLVWTTELNKNTGLRGGGSKEILELGNNDILQSLPSSPINESDFTPTGNYEDFQNKYYTLETVGELAEPQENKPSFSWGYVFIPLFVTASTIGFFFYQKLNTQIKKIQSEKNETQRFGITSYSTDILEQINKITLEYQNGIRSYNSAKTLLQVTCKMSGHEIDVLLVKPDDENV